MLREGFDTMTDAATISGQSTTMRGVLYAAYGFFAWLLACHLAYAFVMWEWSWLWEWRAQSRGVILGVGLLWPGLLGFGVGVNWK